MRSVLESGVKELKGEIGISAACRVMNVARPSFHRRHRLTPAPPKPAPVPHVERVQPQALTEAERGEVHAVSASDRFADASPAHIVSTLLDEERYLCSTTTMYRLIRQKYGHVTDRRDQAVHPARVKPELAANAPLEVWSWDITKLKGPAKWTYYHLYVVIDIFSRYVVAWTVAERESAAIAKALLDEAIAREGAEPSKLTVHSDNGASMASRPVAFLLADLGVTKSHSRPHTSNDNPFSEAGFKTLKYCPTFPKTFDSLTHAREFCTRFFQAYNHDHKHSGIAFLAPHVVHTGQAERVIAERQRVLDTAYAAHPERFRHGRPRPPQLDDTVYINKPDEEEKEPTTA
ncbi:IS3 family transposase [Streptomyces olivoreticuli]